MIDPVVQIQSGLVRGVIEKNEDGFEYYAFKGVPYAEPPIGELRFKDPVPIEKWDGVRGATKYGLLCAQYDLFTKSVSNEEDCLHLNVYTNSINQPNTNKAVMVWIHGGIFFFGCANDYFCGPQYLMRKDIVLVTVNYRLGVFGFLDLEDEVAPGNQGLKDQVMALRCVHQNIRVFGGDSDSVTLFGNSAGGASVHYLTLSPLVRGLVHKAISKSGVAYNSWAIIKNPKKNAIKLCALLGKDLKDSESIVKFLKTIDAQKLQESQERLRRNEGSIPFGPGIDTKSPQPLLPVSPDIALDQGVHIPYLVGHSRREGVVFLLETSIEVLLKMIDGNFDLILSLNAERILKRHNLSVNQFRRLYYKSERVSVENVGKFVDITGDVNFVEGVRTFVKVQTEKSSASTYMYQFSYEAIDSFSKLFITNRIEDSSHVDELNYLFKMRVHDERKHEHFKKGTRSYKMMERMTELWTNYAKYGRPTITTSDLIPIHWLPVADGTLLRYMNLG